MNAAIDISAFLRLLTRERIPEGSRQFCCQRNGKLKSTTVRASTVIIAIYHAFFSSARTFSQNKAWIGLRKLVHNREEGFDKLICFCPVISLLIGEAARLLDQPTPSLACTTEKQARCTGLLLGQYLAIAWQNGKSHWTLWIKMAH